MSREEDLQDVLDQMSQHIFWKDREGKYLGVNKALASVAGFERPEQILGLTDYDMPWTKEESDAYRADDLSVVESGAPKLNIIESQVNATGQETWLETNKVPLKNRQGDIIGLLGWFEDVTERVAREKKLAHEEEKFRAIVETANEWMWEIDTQGQFVYCSPRVHDMLGYEVSELISKKHGDLANSHRAEEINEVFQTLIESGEPFSGVRVTYRHKAGQSVIVESCGVPVKNSASGVTGIRCVSRDITRQVEAERDLVEKYELVEAQRKAIAEMSTPIMQVWEGVLCLPVVGIVDTQRSAEMTDSVLTEVVEKQARCVIVDITGIKAMDTNTTDVFIKMAKAIRFLGAHPILTGISPSIAQTMATIGADLSSITTLRSLKDGLEAYLSGILDQSEGSA